MFICGKDIGPHRRFAHGNAGCIFKTVSGKSRELLLLKAAIFQSVDQSNCNQVRKVAGQGYSLSCSCGSTTNGSALIVRMASAAYPAPPVMSPAQELTGKRNFQQSSICHCDTGLFRTGHGWPPMPVTPCGRIFPIASTIIFGASNVGNQHALLKKRAITFRILIVCLTAWR